MHGCVGWGRSECQGVDVSVGVGGYIGVVCMFVCVHLHATIIISMSTVHCVICRDPQLDAIQLVMWNRLFSSL